MIPSTSKSTKSIVDLRAREDPAGGVHADPPSELDRRRRLEHFACAIAEELLWEVRSELKNRLGAMANAACYIQSRLASDEPLFSDPRVSTFLAVIQQEIEASSGLLDAGTSLARSLAAELQPVSLADAAMRAFAQVDLGSGIQLIWQRKAQPTVTMAPEELHIILECLFNAALDALAGGGRLELAVDDEDGVALLVVAISSEDSPGFDSERTVERLGGRRDGRFPLGLDVVKRAANRYGGRLEIADGPEGSRATLRLPQTETMAEGTPLEQVERR